MVRTNGVPFLSRYIHLIANFSDHVGIHTMYKDFIYKGEDLLMSSRFE